MRRGRIGWVVTALTLGLGASACGGGSDQPATSGPASSSASTATTSATPTPSESASASTTSAPLSQFEEKPQVKAARAFTVAYSSDVNNQDAAATQLLTAMVPNSLALAQKYEKGDLDAKGYQPGPVPFTPTAVKRASAGGVDVFACMQFDGWAVDRTTKKPLDSDRSIKGVRFNLRRVAGQWKVALLNTNDTVKCDSVSVKGVPWS